MAPTAPQPPLRRTPVRPAGAGPLVVGRRRRPRAATEQVVAYVHGLVEKGALKRGDRLPTERELGSRIGISRPSVREGLRLLSALGVVRSRRGAGTFVSAAPAPVASESFALLAALHDIADDELAEARRLVEAAAAALAAERATFHQMATLSHELADMYASLENPRRFHALDLRFHRAVAAAAQNAALSLLTDMALSLQRNTPQVNDDDPIALKRLADTHRRIYHAIRSRDAEAARVAMREHLSPAASHEDVT